MRIDLIVEAEGDEADLLALAERIFAEPDVISVEGHPVEEGAT